MTIRERLEAFWSGERPDRIPYTIYEWEWSSLRGDPAWEPMIADGLGMTYHIGTFTTRTPGVEVLRETVEANGVRLDREILRTPAGDLTQTWEAGWRRKYLLETAEDYRVMTWIARHTVVEPRIDAAVAEIAGLPPFGVALSPIDRTPLQTILVDYAGIERFSLHLYEYEEEVRELHEALLDRFCEKAAIVADGPGRFVSCLENFTAESLGPKRYEEFLLPVYEECFPLLLERDKVIGCHYDGRTASCREPIGRAPFQLIESLTEPPEGDQTLDECRAAWPDKLFWVNIQVGDYQLPPGQLKEKVLDLATRGSVDGRRIAFEVSEQRPENWRESMPVVLEALRETQA